MKGVCRSCACKHRNLLVAFAVRNVLLEQLLVAEQLLKKLVHLRGWQVPKAYVSPCPSFSRADLCWQLDSTAGTDSTAEDL